jgi:RNA polymerase sigma-70 factor (ECF subfamily)
MSGAAGQTTSVSLLGRLRNSPADPAAWQEFVDTYGPKIHHWCRGGGLQEADAEDLTQSILLKLLSVMRSFEYDPSLRFRSWLRTVTQNAWTDLMRSRQKLRMAGSQTDPLETIAARDDLVATIESAYDRELMELATSRVRLRISPKTWDAFRMIAIEQMAVAAVAHQLQMKVAAVYKARSNVQKLVREEIQYLEGSAV